MQETVSCIEAVRRAIAHLGNKYSVQLLLPRILSTTQASVQIDLIVVTHGREVTERKLCVSHARPLLWTTLHTGGANNSVRVGARRVVPCALHKTPHKKLLSLSSRTCPRLAPTRTLLIVCTPCRKNRFFVTNN